MSRFRPAGFRNGRTAWRRASRPIAGGLHGSGAPHFAMGGPHGGGGPHGTPLRLGTRSRHGRRVPRGAPLHGGRQRQIRGSVPAWCSRTGSSNPSPSSGESFELSTPPRRAVGSNVQSAGPHVGLRHSQVRPTELGTQRFSPALAV